MGRSEAESALGHRPRMTWRVRTFQRSPQFATEVSQGAHLTRTWRRLTRSLSVKRLAPSPEYSLVDRCFVGWLEGSQAHIGQHDKRYGEEDAGELRQRHHPAVEVGSVAERQRL